MRGLPVSRGKGHLGRPREKRNRPKGLALTTDRAADKTTSPTLAGSEVPCKRTLLTSELPSLRTALPMHLLLLPNHPPRKRHPSLEDETNDCTSRVKDDAAGDGGSETAKCHVIVFA